VDCEMKEENMNERITKTVKYKAKG